MIPWSRFVEIVRSHRRFVLTTHVRPDGDALGCEVAMAAILRSLGKDVLVCNAFATPPNLWFLDPQRKLLGQLGVDVSAKQLDDREVWIVLDTTAWAQLGAMADALRSSKAVKVVLDHHISGDDLGAELFKDTDAEATGCLVIEAADHLGVPLVAEIARPAFVALATDTGWFRFSSTTSGTLRLASRLVDAGARPDQLYKALYENDSHARLQLIGRALACTRTELDGRLIYGWLENADFAATRALPSDSEDIINTMLSVSGTEVAVILVEQGTGGFKISLRSRCQVDCSAIAERFGGGGHRKAAGAFLNEPLDSARHKILDAVRAAMQVPGCDQENRIEAMQNFSTNGGCCRCEVPRAGETRRGFIRQAIAVVCGGIAVLVPAAAGIAAFLNPLRQKGESGRFVRLLALDVLPDGGAPQRVPVIADRTDAWNRFPAEPIGAVYLSRSGDRVTALQVLCPHEGCPIGYDAQRKLFKCPCHKQPEFDLSGKRAEGPASYSPRDMDALEVEIREAGGQKEVWVKYQTFAQGAAEKVAQG